MELESRWPTLSELVSCASGLSGIELWVFGSALHTTNVNDLDVLVVYHDRGTVLQLRDGGYWETSLPPIEIIAMTADEVEHYNFIEETAALRLYPR